MSAVLGTATALLSFADAESGLWGFAVDLGSPAFGFGELTPGALGSGVAAAIVPDDGDEGDWRISGSAVELAVSPLSTPVPSELLGGFSQLCEVRGRLAHDQGQHELRALGVRELRQGIEGPLGSIRSASAWFAPDDGLTLTSVRPGEAPGHDLDVLAAAVFEERGAQPVADPRLSTTYAADGRPARVGLELWLDGEEEGTQIPVRAAGQATGAVIELSAEGVTARAHAMAWQSHGREGAGAYLLVQPR